MYILQVESTQNVYVSLLNSNNPGKMENARTGAISDVGNPESDFCDRYRAGQEVSSHFAGFNLQLINEKAHRQ